MSPGEEGAGSVRKAGRRGRGKRDSQGGGGGGERENNVTLYNILQLKIRDGAEAKKEKWVGGGGAGLKGTRSREFNAPCPTPLDVASTFLIRQKAGLFSDSLCRVNQ